MKSMNGEQAIRVGCVGGGQLGRMMNLEAPRLGIAMSFLDGGGRGCPAAQTTDRVIQGSLQDASKINELADNADIITVEIEHVNVEALAELEASGKVQVQPSARVLGIIRDKYLQKQHFASHSIATPNFCACSSIEDIEKAAKALGLPLMLKSRRGGYDGRGNAVLSNAAKSSILDALVKLGIPNLDLESANGLDLYAEGWIDFRCEVAVMVVRSSAAEEEHQDATTKCYPCVSAIQQDSICRVVLAPARQVSHSVRQRAEQLAVRAIDSLGKGASGVFGVEMFVTRDDDVLLNEVAPRPHNTGHYTQDACVTSQFENHLRGICGLPLGSTELTVPASAMVNILGSDTMEDTLQSANAALLEMPSAVVHWYGKTECRKGRKMGHINIVGTSAAAVDQNLSRLLAVEKIPISLLPGGSLQSSAALVGVIMGSQSDLPTMNAAIEILKRFKVPHEVDIVSAHRTPDKLLRYSRSAVDRGLSVIIAGAGGAAHLPGMVASMTPLPVIGVPVKTSTLSGVDSLYSIVQMPRGIPVATVAIGNAENAGLLAVRILSASRPHLVQEMEAYQASLSDKVHEMSNKLQEMGSDAFLEQMESKNKEVQV